MTPTEKFERAAAEAFNGGGNLSRIIRYIIIFGWIVAAAAFTFIGSHLYKELTDMKQSLMAICMDVAVFKEWKQSHIGSCEEIKNRIRELERNHK